MAFRLSTLLKDIVLNNLVTNMASTVGTDGTASLNVYSGTQPASADDATAGSLLCSIANIGWAAATGGTSSLAAAAGYSGTAIATGTAGWARFEFLGSAGTYRMDGEVGTASTGTFVINAVSVSSGGIVTLLTANITA
jgi:hypothetical protein